MQSLLPLITILFLSFQVQSQTFTAQQAKEDLQFLAAQMERYNPALLLYNPDFKNRRTASSEQLKET